MLSSEWLDIAFQQTNATKRSTGQRGGEVSMGRIKESRTIRWNGKVIIKKEQKRKLIQWDHLIILHR